MTNDELQKQIKELWDQKVLVDFVDNPGCPYLYLMYPMENTEAGEVYLMDIHPVTGEPMEPLRSIHRSEIYSITRYPLS